MPLLPIKVPAKYSVAPRMTVDQALDILRPRKQVDFHLYTITARSKRDPQFGPGQEAVKLFKTRRKGPVNMLNLNVFVPNEIPSCVANLSAYHILRNTRESGNAGKQTKRETEDLSGCVASRYWQVLVHTL